MLRHRLRFFASFKIKFATLSLIHARLNKSNKHYLQKCAFSTYRCSKACLAFSKLLARFRGSLRR
jgi:hypothetical protein